MFNFFTPTSKVQKDRKIMRETDARMAKYSRRGLIVNFVAYLVCLLTGEFITENRNLSILLTLGLLIITFARGFFLFRFEFLYPRAPGRWRRFYFFVTLCGAAWWGVILAFFTYKLEMQHEAPLLWLYSVVFYSTTAHAFAPYPKFVSYYQFCGLVPSAFAAFAIGTIDGYLYATLILVFYLVLAHQIRLISENFWEKLEATYALSTKIQYAEEEKRDSRASSRLNREFIGFLSNDMQELINSKGNIEPQLRQMLSNIYDFNKILCRKLVFHQRIFNIRHELQYIIAKFVEQAEARHIQIESSLSPTLPMRVRGDVSRLAQIFSNLLALSLSNMKRGAILIDVEFLREYENAGELFVTISRHTKSEKRRFAAEDTLGSPVLNLSFAVCKGLAEQMEGSIETSETLHEGEQFRFNAKFDIVDRSGQLDFHRGFFNGHSIMLIHEMPKITDIKRQELDALGFSVVTETQFKRALSTLSSSYKTENPIDSVFYYLDEGNDQVFEFNHALHEHPELRYIHQVVSVTPHQRERINLLDFRFSESVYLVDRPTGFFELESAFLHVYKVGRDDDGENLVQKERLLAKDVSLNIALYSHLEDIEPLLREQLEGQRCDIVTVSEQIELLKKVKAGEVTLLLVDIDQDSVDVSQLTAAVRDTEIDSEVQNLMPIIAITRAKIAAGKEVYEMGVDDVLALSDKSKNIKSMTQYWASLT